MKARITENLTYDALSHYDAHEDFYHAFLTGMLSMSGYEVRSNRESGNGRPDILVLDVRNESAAIIEVKRASSLQELTSSAQKALLQIEREKYAEGLPPFFEHVVKYGVAFYQKECLVLKGQGAGISFWQVGGFAAAYLPFRRRRTARNRSGSSSSLMFRGTAVEPALSAV